MSTRILLSASHAGRACQPALLLFCGWFNDRLMDVLEHRPILHKAAPLTQRSCVRGAFAHSIGFIVGRSIKTAFSVISILFRLLHLGIMRIFTGLLLSSFSVRPVMETKQDRSCRISGGFSQIDDVLLQHRINNGIIFIGLMMPDI